MLPGSHSEPFNCKESVGLRRRTVTRVNHLYANRHDWVVFCDRKSPLTENALEPTGIDACGRPIRRIVSFLLTTDELLFYTAMRVGLWRLVDT